MDYRKYEGSKYRVDSTYIELDKKTYYEDLREEYVEKAHFVMTKGYKKDLYDRRKTLDEFNLEVLKSKLEYQMKTYGQVDDIDFQEYLYLAKKYQERY